MPEDNMPSMFANAREMNFNGGQFNNVGGNQINYSAESLQLLWQLIRDVGATHNSEIRYPPPQCHPETRREVLSLLTHWIYDDSSASIMWLYGPAGAGKSAIAQTISEKAHLQNTLAGSFFFWRDDPKRNNPKYIFLSLAHDIAHSIPELREHIERAIRANPRILQASLEDQFEKLILAPCRLLSRARRRRGVLVIDGLDECNGSQAQQRILLIIASALLEDMPFRILICSRPELSIRNAFDTDKFRAYLRRVALDNTFNSTRDIEIFLKREFERIRASPEYYHIRFPSKWPASGVIYELAHKASEQFIYAKTVVKFVDDAYFNPCEQLERILHPDTNLESNSPFHDLDVLYHRILSSNPRRSEVRDIMRALLSATLPDLVTVRPFERNPRAIENLLLLQEGDVFSILRGMHSVLNIGSRYDEIRILHASFGDYLRDPKRSGYFYVGNDENLHGFLAYRYLCAIDHWSQVSGGYREVSPWGQPDMFSHAWWAWGIHCSKSDLNGDLLDALRAFVCQNSNSMKLLGSCIMGYLSDVTYRNSMSSMAWLIKHFLYQAKFALRRLQVNPSDLYVDIMERLSDCRRGFKFLVRAERYDQPVSESLNHAFDGLSYFLITGGMTSAPRLSGEVISIGNDCSCTRAEEAASLSFLPCLESTLKDVYHIQLSVSIIQMAGAMMRNVDRWYTSYAGTLHFTTPPELNRGKKTTVSLNRLLYLCDPCPELINLLPPFIAKIEFKPDRDNVLEWLQSCPPEYKSQTLPLIEQVQNIQFKNGWVREWR